MKTKLFSSMAALGLLSLAGAASAYAQRAAVTVVNDSGITIDEVHISETSDRSWEGDLLRSDVLASGYHQTFFEYPGRYDVKLVNATGATCILNNVGIGSDRPLTVMWNLLQCEGF